MKKIRNFIVLVVGAVLFLGSCTNLDESVYSIMTDENLDFTDPQTIEEMAGNVYSYTRKTYWTYYGMWDWCEDASDLHMFPSRIGVGWGTYYCAYHKHEFSVSYNEINYVIWYHSYVGILYANLCLSNEGFCANKQTAAEVRCMRAFLYYILFDSYRNIPILPEGEAPAGFLPEQEEPAKAFDWIVSELETAVKDLPETNQFGKPTVYTAYMILAKMHLNYYAWATTFKQPYAYDEGDKSHYEKALFYADKIIKSGKYSLSPNYLDNHKQDLSTNREVIFAIDLHPTEATGCYLSAVNLPDMGKAAFGYTGGAWNGGCAIPQFIDTYDPDDSRFDDTWAHGQQYDFTTGKKLTGAADGQGTVDVVYTKDVHSIDNPGAYMLEGYRYIKSEIVSGDKGTFGNDTPVFRLSDAYFIAAECALRLGGSKDLPEYTEAKAASLISEVRARAFAANPAKATRTVEQLKGGSVYKYGVREYTYTASYNDAGEIVDDESTHPTFVFEDVWNDPEKKQYCNYTQEGGDDIEFGGLLDDLAWEFVGEFHRRQDLVRFRMSNGANVWNGKSWFCKIAEENPTDFHKDIYPICQQNMDSNHALQQNPGYSK